MKCRNCRKEILESANFCRYCGTKVLREEPAPIPKPAAPEQAPVSAPAQTAPEPAAPAAEPTPCDVHTRKVPAAGTGKKKTVLALAAGVVLLVGGILGWYFWKAPKETEPVTLEDQLSRAETWQERYALGQDYLAQEDFEGAIAAFESALELEGAEDKVRVDLARACYQAKQYDQALREYETLAASGAEPYYEARAECCLALDRRSDAGRLLHEGYTETGNERLQELARKNWDVDALHAYGAYVGFDANYAFGLFDWNHDLTPELFYVWNSEYGNSVGASFQILTCQNGAMQELYAASVSSPGGSLTKDGGFRFFNPATHGYFRSSCLYWDGAAITEDVYLDCYLEGGDFTGYTLHPELNYRWEDDDWERGCFLNEQQVSQESLSQAMDALSEASVALTLYPVMEKACKEQLDYDWDTVSPGASYIIRRISGLSIRDTTYSFGALFYPAAAEDATPFYGDYAVVREDTGGIAAAFTLPFDDFEMYESYYTDYSGTPIQTGSCFTFEVWYGPGMICPVTYDAQEKALYELEPGYYSAMGEYLLYTKLTFDTDSPRGYKLVTPHGDEYDTLLESSTHAGYCTDGDTIYVWGSPVSEEGYTYSGELRDIVVYKYTVGTREKTELATLQAAYVTQVGDGYIKYRLSWDGEEQSISWCANADGSISNTAENGPALTAENRPERALYPRPERTLKAGMTGEDVKYIQALLISMNYDVPSVTGAFDEITEASLIAWQKRHEYEQTGIVDEKTLALMEQAEEIWLKKQAFNPDFTFSTTDIGGNAWSAENFKNYKLTMLNQWASWCGPCIGEMPDLQKLYEAYSPKGLNIVGVMEGSQSDLSKLTELGITYPNIYLTQELEDIMYTGYIPTTIFVDTSGKIVDAHYVGARSYDEWAEIIEALL